MGEAHRQTRFFISYLFFIMLYFHDVSPLFIVCCVVMNSLYYYPGRLLKKLMMYDLCLWESMRACACYQDQDTLTSIQFLAENHRSYLQVRA